MTCLPQTWRDLLRRTIARRHNSWSTTLMQQLFKYIQNCSGVRPHGHVDNQSLQEVNAYESPS